MTLRLSRHISIFGLVFFELKSFMGIARQWSHEKFSICPQSLGAILELIIKGQSQKEKKKNRKASLERQSRRKKKELIVASKNCSNIRVKTLWRSTAFLTRRSIHQNGSENVVLKLGEASGMCRSRRETSKFLTSSIHKTNQFILFNS